MGRFGFGPSLSPADPRKTSSLPDTTLSKAGSSGIPCQRQRQEEKGPHLIRPSVRMAWIASEGEKLVVPV